MKSELSIKFYKMYKRFLKQHITYCNGQWYCYICKLTLESSAKVECHLQEAHQNINNQISDLLQKSFQLSNKKCKELLNHGIVLKDTLQDYFCLSCHCSIPTLNHADEHLKGKRHKSSIEAKAKIKNTQRESHDNVSEKQLSNKCKELLNHGIVLRNTLQDYFCLSCQCSIPSLNHADTHLKGKRHERCIQTKEKIKNTQQNSHDNVSEKQLSSNKKCKELLNQGIVLKDTLQDYFCLSCHCSMSLNHVDAHFKGKRHKKSIQANAKIKNTQQDSHDNVSEKQISNKKCKELLNHGIILKDTLQDYFCLFCHCLILSLNHVDAHLKGKRHKKCIQANAKIKNRQQDSYDNVSEKQSNTSIIISTPMDNVKSSIFTKNISINKLEKYNIDNNKHSVITTTNINSKNIAISQEERISGLFMSSDIAMEIDKSIRKPNERFLRSRQKKFHKSILDRYNKMYQKRFLHFEEIIFVCNEKRLNEIRSNLQFYVSYFNDMSVIETMCCLLCNSTHSYDIHKLYKHIHGVEHVTQLVQLNNEQLKQSRELMKIESTYAKCYACNKNINNNAATIEEHIHSRSHKKNRKQLLEQAEDVLKEFKTLWYSIQYFACVICNTRFKMKIEFMEHLDVKHKAILNMKDASKFDFCVTCATLWYDDRSLTKTFLEHCATRTHKYLTEHNDFTVTPLPQMLEKLLHNIDKIVADLFKQSKNMLNDQRPEELKNDLKKVFEIYNFRKVEVCLFGSRFTGLALQNSDVDIYLNFGDECTEAKLIKNRSQQIQDCLETEPEKWEMKSILDSSRTPIIKIRHRPTGLDCDISFTKSLSLENSKLIKSFNTTYPACQKLILFLKKWLSVGDLTGFNGITNYALTWLVIFYLQIKYNIPSISALIKSHNQSKIVSGWETGISDTIPDTMKVSELELQSKQIHKLLYEFFRYYGNFDYMHYIICPLLGEEYSKESFTEVSTLPDSMSLYIAQLRGIKPEYFRIDSSMCVQDPFDLAHNLTKAVPILTLKRFKHYCNESASILLELCKKKHEKQD